MKNDNLSDNESISILIPARNEASNISSLLDELLKIINDNIEVLVYDDESTDNTASIVREYSNLDKRIKLIQSNGLPNNWLGKNHGCYQLAKKAKGEFYLFIDADVKLYGNIIEAATFYLKQNKLGLLSFFPVQIQKTLGEKASVPMMNYILLTLLPLIFVRHSPFSSHAAANGQFMLFNATIYNETQPHKRFKSSAVEDISIARFFKKEKIKIACVTGDKRIKCRMYKSYSEATEGFSKNISMFFGDKFVLVFLFWFFVSFGFVFVFLSHSKYFVLYLAAILIIQLIYSLVSKQNTLLNIFLFPVQLFFLFQVLIKSIVRKRRKQLLWKGRNIYS